MKLLAARYTPISRCSSFHPCWFVGFGFQREATCLQEVLSLLLQAGVSLEPLVVLLHIALSPHLGLGNERQETPDVVQLLQGVFITQRPK